MNLLIIFTIICFALAAPAMVESFSVKRIGWALLTVAFGVMLPLTVFLLSAFLTPDSKYNCRNGWFDCFHSGKLWLTPLVLWATGALYSREVCDCSPPYRRALIQGLFIGTLVAGGCFAYGWIWVCLGTGIRGQTIWLLVPFYTAVWYGVRLLQALDRTKPTAKEFFVSLLGALPFWIAAIYSSKHIFQTLPSNPPAKCFVVTAASHGHPGLVGPFVEIKRDGKIRRVNHQLLMLWSLEAGWQRIAPRSHAMFRNFYNCIGPLVARRVKSPWMADALYLALKPIEWTACLIILLAAQQNRPNEARVML